MSRILVDMDGVLADFDASYRREFEWIAGPDAFAVERAEQTEYYCTDTLNPGYEWYIPMMTRHIHRRGFFRSLPLVSGAREGLLNLENFGEVWILTKPLMGSDNVCRDEKAVWLDQNIGAGWSDRMITAQDKSLVKGDVLIDDAIKIDQAERADWMPVAFDQPYNQPGTTYGQYWWRFSWDSPDEHIERMLEAARDWS